MGNLSFEVTRDELIEAFGAAGKVVDAKVPTDRETGRPRGFAFVEFADDEAAQKSISLLNGKLLKGRPLRVNEAENRPPRPMGSGGPSSYRPPYRPGGGPPTFPPPGDWVAAGRAGSATSADDRRRARGRAKGEQPPRRTEKRRHKIDDEDY